MRTRRKSINQYKTGLGYCLHCKDRRFLESRGLCSKCYKKMNIRNLYPREIETQRKSEEPPEPEQLPEPTTAFPGSPEKVAILQKRFTAGQHLWHPCDFPQD